MKTPVVWGWGRVSRKEQIRTGALNTHQERHQVSVCRGACWHLQNRTSSTCTWENICGTGLWICFYRDIFKNVIKCFFEGRLHGDAVTERRHLFFSKMKNTFTVRNHERVQVYFTAYAPPFLCPLLSFWPHVSVCIGPLACSGFKTSLRTRRGAFTLLFPTVWKVPVQAYKSHFHFQKRSWWNTLETFPAPAIPHPAQLHLLVREMQI